mgnify:CR=1 FL=1
MCIKLSANYKTIAVSRYTNNRGMSFVEVLVATGLLSIVAVAVTSLMLNIRDSQNLVAALQDVTSYETKLRKTMSVESVCKYNFAGLNIPASPASTPVYKVEISAGQNFYDSMIS